jgi:hypothetical protein
MEHSMGTSLEKFEDTRGVFRICKSKDRKHWPKETGPNEKQRSTKHTHIKLKIKKGKQFLLK